jgi:hypothetical protein
VKNVLTSPLRDVLRSPLGDATSGPPTPGDPLWADVAVVFNFQGPNGSTSPVDGKGHAFTYTGGAVISTSLLPQGALLCDGDAYVQANTDSADFDLPGDFCIEVEAYASSGNTLYNALFDTDGTGSGYSGVAVESSNQRGAGLVLGGAGRAYYNFNPNDSTWHRYTFDRSGTTIRFFLDGVLVATDTYGTAIPAAGCAIGAYLNGLYGGWHGQIAAARMTRASRYTASHTPPALPFPEGP